MCYPHFSFALSYARYNFFTCYLDEKVLMNYKDKLQQANKEAKAAVVALFLTIIVWIVSGFGVAPLQIVVFNTPLWIITGCFGTWIFAIAAAVYMSNFVFKDIDLEDEENDLISQYSDSNNSTKNSPDDNGSLTMPQSLRNGSEPSASLGATDKGGK